MVSRQLPVRDLNLRYKDASSHRNAKFYCPFCHVEGKRQNYQYTTAYYFIEKHEMRGSGRERANA